MTRTGFNSLYFWEKKEGNKNKKGIRKGKKEMKDESSS